MGSVNMPGAVRELLVYNEINIWVETTPGHIKDLAYTQAYCCD